MKIVENIEVQIREVLSGSVRDNHANLTSYSRGVHTAQIFDDLCIVHCCRGRTFSTAFCACQRCRLQRKIVNDSFNGFNKSTICLKYLAF